MVCNPLTANLSQSPQSRPGHCSRTQACLGEHNTHTHTFLCALIGLFTVLLKNTLFHICTENIIQPSLISIEMQMHPINYTDFNGRKDKKILIEKAQCVCQVGLCN